MRRWLIPMLACSVAAGASAADKHSGYDDASSETRAMQDDDSANPGFLWVREGEAQWSTPAGPEGKSCATCHTDAAVSMRGVTARYPLFDATQGRPITLEQRIAQCRTERQHADLLPPESDAALGLSAYVGLQSRGMPVQVAIDGPARPFFEAGRTLFNTRMGQLNLSCAQCHDQHAGQRLAGAVIPQGHPNGYPEYRAEPFPPDSAEMTNLALFLAARADGLKIETPAVRP